MGKVTGVLLFLGVVAIGGWFAWAAMLDRGFDAWLDQRRGEGWLAEAETVKTTGFPSEFRTVATALELADPDTGLSIQLSELVLRSDSLSPNDITADLPESFSVATPQERIAVEAGQFDASLAVDPGPALGVKRADLLLDTVSLTSSERWTSAIGAAELRTLRDEGDDTVQDITLTATGFRPSEPLRRALDPAQVFPDVIERMEIDATVDFDRKWDRSAIEDSRPQIEALDLTKLDAVWGDARLEAAGQLDVDADGVPTGEITVRATNWRDIYRVIENAGVIPEAFSGAVESVLESLAGLSGSPDTIDAPLTFRNGFIVFGPLPIGPAPRLTIR